MSAVRWSAALVLDLALGEPPRAVHPVVLAGKAIAAAERRAPDDARAQRTFGLALVGLPAAIAALVAIVIGRVPSAALRAIGTIWLLKTAFALRDLLEAGSRVEASLRRGDIAGARSDLAALVSRETSDLRSDEIASAAIESLAENLCDSYVAPLLFYRFGGLPAALAYRVVNTADAMVGYRGRYEHLGKAAARLDDAFNWIPARASALALASATALRSRSAARRAASLTLREHGRTASPNAGWPMSAAAGALDLRLAKRGHYSLNDAGRVPAASDIRRARDLVALASALTTLAVLLSYRWGRR